MQSGSLDLGRVEALEDEVDAQSFAVNVLQLVLVAIRPVVIAKSIQQHFILELMVITNYVKDVGHNDIHGMVNDIHSSTHHGAQSHSPEEPVPDAQLLPH